jgi:ribosome-binding ATPase YchF (GTP1/OBG family)
LPPDYKSYYKNDEFIFDKPILIVANKYLKDPWANNKIMNNINLNTLEWIFDNYKENYEIIYNRMSKENNLTFQDRELCKKYNIKMLENIIKTSYNITQVKLYANAKKFISVQGGQAVLCSYFGGTNIILSQTGKDVKHKDFYKTYPRLSGAKIIWEKEIKELKKRIKENL